MPRTFLVKSFKKREGKTSAEVENCTLHDKITNYQQKKRKNSENAEVFTPNTAAASLTDFNGKSLFKRDATKTGIFMPNNGARVKYNFNKEFAGENIVTIANRRRESSDSTDSKEAKRSENGFRHNRNSPVENRNLADSFYEHSQFESVYQGKERILVRKSGRESVEIRGPEDLSFHDKERNSRIRRPIALMPEQCHCDECRRQPKIAFYDRQRKFLAPKGGDTREFYPYEWKHQAKTDRVCSTVEGAFKTKKYYYHGSEVDFRERVENYDDVRSFYEGQRKGNQVWEITHRSKELDRAVVRTPFGGGYRPNESGSVSSNRLTSPDMQSRARGDGHDEGGDCESSTNGSRPEDVLRQIRVAETNSPTTGKKRKIYLQDEMLIKEPKQLVNGNIYENEFHRASKKHKTSFKIDEVNRVKPKIVAIKAEKDCSSDEENLEENKEVDGNEINRSKKESKDQSEFWKLKENGIQKLKNINIKVEKFVDNEEWSTEPDSNGAGRDYRSNRKEICSDGKKKGRKLNMIKNEEQEKGKCEMGCNVSPPYLPVRSEAYTKYTGGRFEVFRRDRQGSNGEECIDEEEESIEGAQNEFEQRHQDMMLTNRVSREVRDKEKRAMIKRLKEREAGKKTRAVANWLERKRVAELNEAFELLRKIVPSYGNEDRSLSKIKTLRYASTYISHLAMIYDKQCRYGSYDVKQGLVNLLEIDPLIQRCQEHLQTRSVI